MKNRVAWGLALGVAVALMGGIAYREGRIRMPENEGGRRDAVPLGDPAQRQKVRDKYYAMYEALGDHSNAVRLRLLDELQDRKRNTAYDSADLDHLLAMLAEPGLNTDVTTTIFGKLCTAVQRHQIPSGYPARLRQTALTALRSHE